MKTLSNFRPILYLFFLFFLFLNSCQSENKKTVKIGFLFNSFDLPRWERERDYFKEKVTELGAEVVIASADGDEAKQYSQAQEFIKQGVDVIVITPSNVNTAALIVRDAHKNGVKVIAYDGLIQNSELDYAVGFELFKVGELQAQYVVKKKPTGNYVILNGDKVHDAAIDLYHGILKVLEPSINSGKINILYTGWMENWSGTSGEFYSNKILEFSIQDVDVIIAANDGIAGGVVEELKKRGLDKKIIITGQDGDLSACNRIMNGTQTMTVYKSSKLIANTCAEIAMKVAKNEKIEGVQYRFNGRIDVPSIILEPVVVDKSKMESIIVAEGVYTMDEIINYSGSDN